MVAGLELEIAHETKVQPLPSVEDVLMEIAELRRDTDKSRGVCGTLQVDLESLHPGAGQGDVAIHDVDAVTGIHGYVDPVEELQGREPGICVVDDNLVIQVARLYGIHVAEYPAVEMQVLVPGYVHVPEMVFPERTCILR